MFSDEADESASRKGNGKKSNPIDPPDTKYPGDDPTRAPKGYEWRGKGSKGSKQGNDYNPETDISLHPDLDHPKPIAPHWGITDGNSGTNWRIYPDGRIELKH